MKFLKQGEHRRLGCGRVEWTQPLSWWAAKSSQWPSAGLSPAWQPWPLLRKHTPYAVCRTSILPFPPDPSICSSFSTLLDPCSQLWRKSSQHSQSLPHPLRPHLFYPHRTDSVMRVCSPQVHLPLWTTKAELDLWVPRA